MPSRFCIGRHPWYFLQKISKSSCNVCHESWYLIYPFIRTSLLQEMTTCIFFMKINNYKHSLNYDYCKRENLWSVFLTKFPNMHKKSVLREHVKEMRHSQNNLHNRADSYFHMTLLTGNQKSPFLWEKSGVALRSKWMWSTEGLQRQAKVLNSQEREQTTFTLHLIEWACVCMQFVHCKRLLY